MWNNGNDCGCLWIILIVILLCSIIPELVTWLPSVMM